MNKHCYRIIFSRKQGQLVVVSELAKSEGSSSSVMPSDLLSQQKSISIIATLRPLFFMTSVILGSITLANPVMANIVADANAPGNQQPQITQSGNGTPQVNIQTPSKGGVSHNKYSQFDVDKKGVILNNSRHNTQTQLGGYIAGNNNLAGGEAKIILNEINSRHPSQLNGYIEVAGKKAQVIIANASGITCDGCGFINADRSTLTTGRVQVENGLIKGYDVQKGKVSITGKGLDSSRQGYTDIIARSVEVNAGIWANDLNVVAGRNQVSADLKNIQAHTDDGSVKPTLAVDVANLGGMYAGRIHLIGTEKGVGVVNAGHLGASAGSVVISADGRIVNSGSMQAQKDIQLTSRNNIENHKQLYAKGNINVKTNANVINKGSLVAQNNVSIKGKAVSNSRNATLAAGIDERGQLTQMGHLDINAESAVLQGQQLAKNNITIRSNGLLDMANSNNYAANIDINSGQLVINNATFKTAEDLSFNTAGQSLDSQNASLTALGNMTINTGFWQNNNSTLSSDGKLIISASDIINTGATLLADDFSLNAHSLTGDGKLLSRGDMALSLNQTFTNQSEVMANGKLTLNTAQDIINQHKIVAGQVDLISQQLVNQKDAEISGDVVNLAHTGLTNRGLIDGGLVVAKAQTIYNLGSGRIYGDDIALQATVLNNLFENGHSATIAARNSLNLGVNELNNKTHSLIMSLGSFMLSKQLDGNNQATIGQASTINNHSAKLESGGDMVLNVDTLNNINDDLRTELVKIGEQYFTKYCHVQSTLCFSLSEVRIIHKNGKNDNFLQLETPESDERFIDDLWNFNGFEYLEEYYQTQITHSDPAEIISGGNLEINGNIVTNTDSKIVASERLSINADLTNFATKGDEFTVTSGTHTYYYRDKKHGKYEGRQSHSNYAPVDPGREFDLQAGKIAEYQSIQNSTLADSQRDNPQVDNISTIEPNTNLPNNSLFQVNKNPDSGYLIETDPRFTNYKKWLGSDYMLDKMKSDPNSVMKRLGDGYYEQQLIREQITGLTGQRYLGDYRDDTEQYKALMNAGIEYAEKFNLKLGIALTKEQMQQLTSDMVWMVKKTVTLADGSRQEVLVPQVYMVNRPNITTDGALLAGRNVQVKTTGNIDSSGTIVGKDQLSLIGHDVNNSGKLTADKLAIQAIHDINSRGSIAGDSLVSLQAGNDINISSSTRTSQKGHDLTTNISQIASVTVKDGDMQLAAGRDVNLTAAQIENGGKGGNTLITAGNDINMDTLSVRKKESNIINNDNYRNTDVEKVVGTEVVSAGNMALQAGNNLNAKAALVSSERDLTVQANNINLTSAEERNQLDVKSKQTSKGVLSKSTRTTVNQLDESTQKGSDFSGQNVILLANNDINVQGSQVKGVNQVNLGAGNNINIEAVAEYREQNNSKSVTKSGLMSSGGMGVMVGKTKEAEQKASAQQTFLASGVSSAQGNVNIQAGGDLSVKGSHVAAQGDINAKAQNINIESLDVITRTQVEYQKKSTGLTVNVAGKDGVIDRSGIWKSISDSAKKLSVPDVSLNAFLGTQNTKTSASGEQHQVISSGLSAGNNITLQAEGNAQGQGGDVNIMGSQIKAGNNVAVDAVGDLNIVAAANSQHSQTDTKTTNAGLTAKYGSGTKGVAVGATIGSAKSQEQASNITWTGSAIEAGNNITLVAKGNGQGEGGDISILGSQIKAGNNVTMDANRDLTISAVANSQQSDKEGKNTAIGVNVGKSIKDFSVNVSSGKTQETTNGITWTGSTIEAGNNVSLTATGNSRGEGGDIDILGSQIKAGNNVAVEASRDLNVSAVANSQDSGKSEKSTNLAFNKNTSNGAKNIAGSAASANKQEMADNLTWVASSIEGGNNVSLVATDNSRGEGGDVNILASQVKAGNNVTVEANRDLTISAMANSQKSGKSEKNANANLNQSSANDAKNVSGGMNSAKSQEKTNGITWSSSTIEAGNNITLVATGNNSGGQGGDINIHGSQIKAGSHVAVDANRDVNVTATENSQQSGKVASSSNVNLTKNKVNGATGNMGSSHEQDRAETVSWNESVIEAGNKLTIKSGHDVNIVGGQLKGDRVEANIGNDLNIQSLQDIDNSKYGKTGATINFTSNGAGKKTNASGTAAKVESNLNSVKEQSGIFAGKGGYDIRVEKNTDLKGAVIASGAEDITNNQLDTGTLSFSDIENKTDYMAAHVKASVDTALNNGQTTAKPGKPNGSYKKGQEANSTKSAVEEGDIIIRDQYNQRQDISTLSRDTDNANQVQEAIFDKQQAVDKINKADENSLVNKKDKVIEKIEHGIEKIEKGMGQVEGGIKDVEKLTNKIDKVQNIVDKGKNEFAKGKDKLANGLDKVKHEINKVKGDGNSPQGSDPKKA